MIFQRKSLQKKLFVIISVMMIIILLIGISDVFSPINQSMVDPYFSAYNPPPRIYIMDRSKSKDYDAMPYGSNTSRY